MENNVSVGSLLVTATAWEKVKNTFTFSEKREVAVKGYGETTTAYVTGGE